MQIFGLAFLLYYLKLSDGSGFCSDFLEVTFVMIVVELVLLLVVMFVITSPISRSISKLYLMLMIAMVLDGDGCYSDGCEGGDCNDSDDDGGDYDGGGGDGDGLDTTPCLCTNLSITSTSSSPHNDISFW